MTREMIIVLIILGGFGLLLYVGPTYFRRLRLFIARLQSDHRSTFEALHRPSLSIRKIKVESAYAVTAYVLRRRYLRLQDETLAELGDAVRWRLVAYIAIVVGIAVLGPAASVIVK